jgi:tRNA threonylcarbamoyladenosine biosynthesis protein TsaB
VSALVLAIDTTHEQGSLALLRGGELLEEALLDAPDGFGHVLYGRLAALLERHRVAVCEVDCFAAASGPGSFTGVRVGLACVKGLAEAAGKPAVGVSSLQALAFLGRGPLRAPVFDARRGEIYGAVYDGRGLLVQPEVVAFFEEWRATLPAGAEIVELRMPLAAAVGRIAWERLSRGEAGDPTGLDANYVRRPDAELLFRP